MKRVAEVMGVSRSELYQERRTRTQQDRPGDAEVLKLIRAVVKEKPTFGYRRVTAMLRQRGLIINHKRIYRLMSRNQLLLRRYASKPERPHEGKVITLKSNLRWCSDMFEIRCWSGERVYVAFSLDCCDREAISWLAADRHLDGADVRDLMAQSVERRFSSTHVPHPLEWLSDNGPPYTAHETRHFGHGCGFVVCTTPSYSPESNGMAEAFVKTFKRDFVYLGDVSSAEAVMKQLPRWFEEYNETHPHKGLNMLSPRQFRRLQSA